MLIRSVILTKIDVICNSRFLRLAITSTIHDLGLKGSAILESTLMRTWTVFVA